MSVNELVLCSSWMKLVVRVVMNVLMWVDRTDMGGVQFGREI